MAAAYAIGLAVSLGLSSRVGRATQGASVSVTASLGAGIRAAWQEPTVRAVLLITVLMNVLLFPYQHMLAVFSRDVLKAGPEWLGALVAADGLGSLLGALVISASRRCSSPTDACSSPPFSPPRSCSWRSPAHGRAGSASSSSW